MCVCVCVSETIVLDFKVFEGRYCLNFISSFTWKPTLKTAAQFRGRQAPASCQGHRAGWAPSGAELAQRTPGCTGQPAGRRRQLRTQA